MLQNVTERRESLWPQKSETLNTENCSGEVLAILLMNGTIQENRKLILEALIGVGQNHGAGGLEVEVMLGADWWEVSQRVSPP